LSSCEASTPTWLGTLTDPVRHVVAVFVVAGVFVSLLSRVTQPGAPLATQYNNAIWFFVESKQLAWPFALETLWRWSRGRRALSTATALVAVVLLAVPSFVQFLSNIRKIPATRIGRSEVALDDFLRSACAPGDVVFARQQTAKSIVMLTPCRVPLVSAYVLTNADLVSARAADQGLFWAAWTRGDVEWHTLERYGSRFLVVPARPRNGARPDRRGYRDELEHLAVRFTNDDFTVFEVAR
jgi:hypothetical protein